MQPISYKHTFVADVALHPDKQCILASYIHVNDSVLSICLYEGYCNSFMTKALMQIYIGCIPTAM